MASALWRPFEQVDTTTSKGFPFGARCVRYPQRCRDETNVGSHRIRFDRVHGHDVRGVLSENRCKIACTAKNSAIRRARARLSTNPDTTCRRRSFPAAKPEQVPSLHLDPPSSATVRRPK